MIPNLKRAWRHILKSPGLSIIKIVGLSLGIATSVLLFKYIAWQKSFDQFHKHKEHIVRVQTNVFNQNNLVSESALTPSGLAVLAHDRFPEVRDYVRLGKWIARDIVISNQQNIYRGEELYFTDPSFLDVFSFPLLQGDPNTALSAPNNIILTESMANKFFGNSNPIGQEMLFENFKPFRITGIIVDPPAESHIQYKFLTSLVTMDDWQLEVYGDEQLEAMYVYTYLHLQNNSDLGVLETNLTAEVQSMRATTKNQHEFKLQPLSDIHLHAVLDQDITQGVSGKNISILLGISLLVLMMSWINNHNITLSENFKMIKSLTIQRVIGASKFNLFNQVATKSLITSVISILAGIAIAILLQPILTKYYDVPFAHIRLLNLQNNLLVLFLTLALFCGTIASGILAAWPALKIGTVLPKNENPISQKNHQKLLVSVQFTLITAMIASTCIVLLQARFIANQDLGFKANNVVSLRAPLGFPYQRMESAITAFKNEVIQMPQVESMAISRTVPGEPLELVENISYNGRQVPPIYRNVGSPTFFNLYGIKLLASLPDFNPTQTDGTVLNRSAAQLLGISPEDALGTSLTRWDEDQRIIAVVEDYHQRSMHHRMPPTMFEIGAHTATDGFYSIRLAPGADQDNVISTLKEIYEGIFTNTVFEHLNMEEHYASQYADDRTFKNLNIAFSIVGIIIACLGLMSLLMIYLIQARKELSIRKILGAHTRNLIPWLIRGYVSPILLAIVMAIPITYLAMANWLQRFNYRIEFPFWVFIASSLVVVIIAFTIISLLLRMAINENPATVLQEN